MDFDKFKTVMRKYKPWGIRSGYSSLILSPEKTLNLIDELAASDVVIVGGSVWYYVDRGKGWAREDIENWWSLEKADLQSPDAVQRGITLAKDYIRNHLPRGTDAVSLTFELTDIERKATFLD